jgi:acyl-CoA synthetase (AMP-forming)/AMP-acid ligase II
MEGLDLSKVHVILSGAERVHSATVNRFVERFAKFGLKDRVVQPSYGLAEATLYVATPEVNDSVRTANFDLEQLAAGVAVRCEAGRDASTELVTYGPPRAYPVRIVDPETGIEKPEGAIGEIWVRGDNVALGYWRKPELTTRMFRAMIKQPSAGTPAGPWLRTGDLGAVVVNKVGELPAGHGFNAATLTYGDLIAEGVIDPVKVTRSAVLNAASVARMILTTETAIVEKPADYEDHGHHGHSH